MIVLSLSRSLRNNLVPRSPDGGKKIKRKGARKTFDPVHLHRWWWMRGPCAKDNHSEESQIEFFSGLAKADSSMSTPSQWKHLGKAGQASTPDQKIIHYDIKRKGSPKKRSFCSQTQAHRKKTVFGDFPKGSFQILFCGFFRLRGLPPLPVPHLREKNAFFVEFCPPNPRTK